MKFEYPQLPELITRGQMVLVHKQILCCKKRHAPPTEVLQKDRKAWMDIDKVMEKWLKEMRQEVRRRRNEFWECKKSTETKGAGWILELAKD